MITKRTRYYKPYCFLVILRIILVIVPQIGYIHPDEYFQSIEIFAGNVFDLESKIPWEFNVTYPIRSIGVTYFTVGMCYKILKSINYIPRNLFDISVITPYFLLVTPRLLICILSLMSDYSLYKICLVNNENYHSKLLILASSYVMLVYGSRTFSNTIELILFSCLLYFVAESMIFSNIIIKQQEYLTKRYNNSKKTTDKARFHKLRLFLIPHNYRNVFIISNIVVLGFFNRPTFLVYAVCPLFFWTYRGLGFKSVTGIQFHGRLFLLLISALPLVLIFVVIDSFYFAYITLGEVIMLDISIENFVFPAFNFIKYNMNKENLKEHGLHPKYLHILVNFPLLFNILAVMAFITLCDFIRWLMQKKYHLLPGVRSIKGLMTASLYVPLCVLSAFSHQEPRFIIPLLFPMIYLYSNKIHYEHDDNLLETSTLKKGGKSKRTTSSRNNRMLKIWLMVNLMFTIFYGFLHQGGIYPFVKYLSEDINLNNEMKYDIFTTHMYNLPRSFLLQPKIDKVYKKDGTKYQLNQRVNIFEEGSREIKFVIAKASTLANVASKKSVKNKVVLAAPSSLYYDVIYTMGANYSHITLNQIKTFYPHISTEALPKCFDFILAFSAANFNSYYILISNICKCILRSLSLSVYELSSH